MAIFKGDFLMKLYDVSELPPGSQVFLKEDVHIEIDRLSAQTQEFHKIFFYLISAFNDAKEKIESVLLKHKLPANKETIVEIINHEHDFLNGRHIYIEKEEPGKPNFELGPDGCVIVRLPNGYIIDRNFMEKVENFVKAVIK